jgi:hypothetical protein
VVERIAILLLLYFWLARVFSARAAFFGTFVACVGVCGNNGDTIAHYDFDAMLAFIAAGLAASVALTSARG